MTKILKLLSLTLIALLSTQCKSVKNIESTVINHPSQIKTEKVPSSYLSESKEISIYIPALKSEDKNLPVVYATDGQTFVKEYKRELDSLIENNAIPKIIIVGVHSDERQIEGTDFSYRNYEYVKSYSDSEDEQLSTLFEKHYNFFSKELIAYVESGYPVSRQSKDRIFYGFSNGAGFGVSLATDNPSIIGNYICMSMAGGSYENLNWSNDNYPNIILSYGSKEPFPLTMQIDEYSNFLKERNINHTFYKYEGGHDRKKWKEEFLKALIQILN
jgi:enterochelin esterase-like enzyme